MPRQSRAARKNAENEIVNLSKEPQFDLNALFPHDKIKESIAANKIQNDDPTNDLDSSNEEIVEAPVSEDEKTPEKSNLETEKSEYTDAEKEAMQKGWRPKDEFKGDASEWTPARQWLKQKDLYDRISTQNKQIKEMRDMVNRLVNFAVEDKQKNAQTELSKIKEIRTEAIRRGDVDAVERIDAQLESSKQEITRLRNVNDEIPQEVKDFAKDNSSWFNTDTPENEAMWTYARRKDSELMKQYPQMDLSERLEMTKRLTFDYFHNKNTSSKKTVETLTGLHDVYQKKSRSNEIEFNSLPDIHKKVILDFEMRLKKPDPNYRRVYIKSLKDRGTI